MVNTKQITRGILDTEYLREVSKLRRQVAAADALAAAMRGLEAHYTFGNDDWCDWCETKPHAEDCPFAVLRAYEATKEAE